MSQHFLSPLFSPQAIAVFGASARPDSVGGRILANLKRSGFPGPLYPVNPRYHEVYGEPCYKTIGAIPDAVDLAIIATPAATVAGLLRESGDKGVKAAVVITAGFGEQGAQGKALEQELVAIAAGYGMHFLGPNCLGLLRPQARMNATFSKGDALPGAMALVSQSGALCTTILDWAQERSLGFSAVVSTGAAADIGFGDILDYLAQDPHTHSILLYVEGIRHARRFISGLRSAARLKPVVVLKAGRHARASVAATTHTGAIVGADAVFDAALQRAGVVRAYSIEQLFAAAQLLRSGRTVRGNRLAILTNGGGLGVMAVDRALDLKLELGALAAETLQVLDAGLPPQWSHANPVDILGDADAARYERALLPLLEDDGVDGILVMLSPQSMTDTLGTATIVAKAAGQGTKPVMACWMASEHRLETQALFTAAQIPWFNSPETAVEAFAFLASHYRNQQLLLQMPAPLAPGSTADLDAARRIIVRALSENRNMLDLLESKELLRACAIGTNSARLCRELGEALSAADEWGYPVALKVYSRFISHKSDVGGVKLDIADASALRAAWRAMQEDVARHAPGVKVEGMTIEPMYTGRHGRELLVGVVRDPVFGPAISFGAGGVNVEVLRDRSVALPPLNTLLVDKLIDDTRVAATLGQFRGSPAADRAALVQVLRRISELVCEIPEVKALDINPLIVDETGVLALDARIEITRVPAGARPYAHMAIHPWPVHLLQRVNLIDGTAVILRPIRAEDAAGEQRFIRQLSAQTRHFRFMQEVGELSPQALLAFSQPDFDREMTLVITPDPVTGNEDILGMVSYTRNPDGKSAEFALVVSDAWQGKGMGTLLMKALIDVARQEGYEALDAEVLANNANMLELMRFLGFHMEAHAEDPALRVVRLQLNGDR